MLLTCYDWRRKEGKGMIQMLLFLYKRKKKNQFNLSEFLDVELFVDEVLFISLWYVTMLMRDEYHLLGLVYFSICYVCESYCSPNMDIQEILIAARRSLKIIDIEKHQTFICFSGPLNLINVLPNILKLQSHWLGFPKLIGVNFFLNHFSEQL